jgi:hypothetical protein
LCFVFGSLLMHVMVLSFFAPCPQSCSFVLHSYSSFLLLIFSPSLFLLFTLTMSSSTRTVPTLCFQRLCSLLLAQVLFNFGS